MKVFGDELIEIIIEKNRVLSRTDFLSFKSMALYENNSKIIISDTERNRLNIFDLKGNFLLSIHIDINPTCICVPNISNKNEILIGDIKRKKIFAITSKFDDLRLFINDVSPEYISIDNEFNRTRLYVSERNNQLSVWNTNSGIIIGSIKIMCPKNINFSEQNIYVSSLEHKNCCIYEIKKDKLETKRRITGDWYSPFVLNIESNGNIIILAFIGNQTKDTLSVSEMRYFLIIDKNGHHIKKIELPEYKNMCDSILFRKKLFICYNALNKAETDKLRLFELSLK